MRVPSAFLPFPSSCLTIDTLGARNNSPFVCSFCPFSLLSHVIHPALIRFEQSLTKSHDRSDFSPDTPSLAPGTTAWTVTPPSLHSRPEPRSEMTAPILLLRLQGHTCPSCFPGAAMHLLGTSLNLSHALMPPQGITLQLRDLTSCYKFSHFVYGRILLANYHHQV